jgi:hypothetical protein
VQLLNSRTYNINKLLMFIFSHSRKIHGLYFKSLYNSFLPHTFHFINSQSSHHLTVRIRMSFYLCLNRPKISNLSLVAIARIISCGIPSFRPSAVLYHFYIPLCVNSHNQKIDYFVKNTKILYNYWYFVMATCFGLSLDHLQVNVHK